MRLHQRRGLALVLVCLATTSGCLGVFSAGVTTFEAAPADVGDGAAAETGFERNGTRDSVVTRQLGPESASKTVRVVSKVTTYEKPLEIPRLGSVRLGIFSVISTPAVEVAGQTFNPIGEYSNDRLVDLVTDRFGSFSGLERVRSRQVVVRGTETTVTTYAATTTARGQEVPVFVHVTRLRDGDDFLVGIGVYPRAREQRAEITTLLRAIEHPAEA
ncbi:DUF6517 family protein [Salinigranum marinum]|uniref:DUF6517 family protein n=1 Tax=Salinigranum marinum TaxID=1515595 RepID=UPI002989FFF7|nr:DUF6517 family protein [Salinigranum marinum]